MSICVGTHTEPTPFLHNPGDIADYFKRYCTKILSNDGYFNIGTLQSSDVTIQALVSPFTDGDSIADYAKDGVELCVKAGINTGYKDGSFKPTAKITREEAATMLVRLLRLA